MRVGRGTSKCSSRLERYSFELLRTVTGFMISCHGFAKIFGVLGPKADLASQIGIGGILEFVLGMMVFLGIGERLAAFLLSGEMAVAYFQFHWRLDLTSYRFLPMVNHGEVCVLYSFVFLAIASRGAERPLHRALPRLLERRRRTPLHRGDRQALARDGLRTFD